MDKSLYVPESGCPRFFDTFDEETREEMSQEMVDDVIDEWGDDNPIHVYEGMATVFNEETGLFDVELPEDSTIVPGALFAYEAVRQADGPVESLTADYDKPVDTTNEVALDRKANGEGEEVITLERPDLETYIEDGEFDDAVTAETTVNYADESMPNAANAYKVAGTLGLDDHHGEVLLGVDAEFGDGTGELAVEDVSYEELKDLGPMEIGDETYTLEDGTEITYTLLDTGEAYDVVMDAAEEEGVMSQDGVGDEPQTVAGTVAHATADVVSAQTEAYRAQAEAYRRGMEASMDFVRAVSPTRNARYMGGD